MVGEDWREQGGMVPCGLRQGEWVWGELRGLQLGGWLICLQCLFATLATHSYEVSVSDLAYAVCCSLLVKMSINDIHYWLI